MKGADYTNLAVTTGDHAEIDEAIRMIPVRGMEVGCLLATNGIEDRNPANPNEVIAQWPKNDHMRVCSLFDVAYSAQKKWRRVSFRDRIAVMRRWASVIEDQLPEFIAAMVLETGKPRGEAKAEACEAVALIR